MKRLIIQDLENFQEDLSLESSEVQGGLSLAVEEPVELKAADDQLIAYPTEPYPLPYPNPCWYPKPLPCHYEKPIKLTADSGEVVTTVLWCPVIL